MSQLTTRNSRATRELSAVSGGGGAAVSPSPAAAASMRSSMEADKPSVGCIDRLFQVIRGERKINHVAAVLKMSLGTNILIVLTMTGVAISSKSLALLSTLIENMVDLFVQGLLAYAGTRSGKKQDYAKFPAGTSRFEPVAVIVAASVMMIVSVVFIEEGTTKLVDGFVHGDPVKPHLSLAALVISGMTITTKIFLIFYSKWVLKTHTSAAVEAISDDNRNDVVSNSFAITAYIIASMDGDLWYVDPIGAILIFLVIMFAWAKMGKEQVMQLVGVTASEEFITEVKTLCHSHNAKLSLDIVRAYHFGSKYLVELEVVVPAEMTVKDAHDIALQLQFKVEQLEEVERAFVHVDYKPREYDEHIVSREEDALLNYAGYSGSETASSPAGAGAGATGAGALYLPVPQVEEDTVEVVVTPSGRADGSVTPFQQITTE